MKDKLKSSFGPKVIDPLGFGSAVLSPTEGSLKISPLFPNGLTPSFKDRKESRREG